MEKVHSRTLKKGSPTHSFQTLMKDLEIIVRNTYRNPKGASDVPSFEITTIPSDTKKRAFDLISQIKM